MVGSTQMNAQLASRTADLGALGRVSTSWLQVSRWRRRPLHHPILVACRWAYAESF